MFSKLKTLFLSQKKIPFCSVIVAAAGSSTRMDGQNKLLLQIGGKPVLAHTLSALSACKAVNEIIVVTRAEEMEAIGRLCTEYNMTKVAKIIPGGKTRTESVYYGVLQASSDAELIAVHDGARPFVSENTIVGAIEAAIEFNAAAPAVPVTSTVKQAKDGFVVKTVDRSDLFEIQTPQIFKAEVLVCALKNALDRSLNITDDCMAVEALGCRVRLTRGERENIKLTTKADIVFAEAIFSQREDKA